MGRRLLANSMVCEYIRYPSVFVKYVFIFFLGWRRAAGRAAARERRARPNGRRLQSPLSFACRASNDALTLLATFIS